MLTQLDQELYPFDCEVVSIPESQQNVFLIYKNASSSIRMESEKQKGWTFNNKDVHKLKHIDVYLRDPLERYISGTNTYLQRLLKENPSLDKDTALFFIKEYNFLNRHYLPQFHWLLNLHRMNSRCMITLHDISEVSNITEYVDTPVGTELDMDVVTRLDINNNKKLQFWFFIDYILREMIGKTKSFDDIMLYYKQQQPFAFAEMFKDICELLRPVYELSTPKTFR